LKKTVEFRNVSKHYNLGLTRISLPSYIAAQSKKLLKLTNTNSKSDKSFWALQDVSFDLKEGQSLALVGPNGAGKTTILKLLANITKPTSGAISLQGKLSALIELGAGFHPDLTGRENIFLNGTILGLKRSEIRRRFDEILDFSELEKFIDTPVKRYSSGMAVRLGFAVAACIEPDILLVDEVLAVGDASFRQKCMDRIKRLLNQGTSLIFVSHNLGLVKAVCESALYLDHGRVEYRGTTEEVVDYYTQVLNEERIQKLGGVQEQVEQLSSFIELTGVEIVGSSSTRPENLYPEQGAIVNIKYLSYKSMPAVHVVVRFIRSDGVSCSVVYSRRDGAHLFLEEGIGEINLSLNPLQLYPGMYYLSVTVKNEDESVPLARGWSDWFKVTGLAPGYVDLDAVFEPVRSWQQTRDTLVGESIQDTPTSA
jgi:lipopolysaccharide transport system ATP-binding protein